MNKYKFYYRRSVKISGYKIIINSVWIQSAKVIVPFLIQIETLHINRWQHTEFHIEIINDGILIKQSRDWFFR